MINLASIFNNNRSIYQEDPMKNGFSLVENNKGITEKSPVVVTPTAQTPKVEVTTINGMPIKAIDPSITEFYKIKPQLAGINPSKDIGYRNNNPGNLRDISTGKFRKFATLEDGWNALQHDFNIKVTGKSHVIGKDASVKDFIYAYAPPSENDSGAYLKFVEDNTGIDPNISISSLNEDQRNKLLKSIVKIESPNSYVYLFDKDKYRTAMASIKRRPSLKGGGILYTKHKNNYYEKN